MKNIREQIIDYVNDHPSTQMELEELLKQDGYDTRGIYHILGDLVSAKKIKLVYVNFCDGCHVDHIPMYASSLIEKVGAEII